MSAYQFNDQVLLPTRYHGLHFGLVTGTVGVTHCKGLEVFMVELDTGEVGQFCECGMMRAPHHNVKVKWGHCLWRPKELRYGKD